MNEANLQYYIHDIPPPAAQQQARNFDLNNNNPNNNHEHESAIFISGSGFITNYSGYELPLLLQQKHDILEKMKDQGEAIIATTRVKQIWSFEECEICCEKRWLLSRPCCNYHACLDCLSRYYTSKVEMQCLSIECINTHCDEPVYRTEVNSRLSPEKRHLYARLLLEHSSESDKSKPCPRCNTILTIDSDMQKKLKKKSNFIRSVRKAMPNVNSAKVHSNSNHNSHQDSSLSK